MNYVRLYFKSNRVFHQGATVDAVVSEVRLSSGRGKPSHTIYVDYEIGGKQYTHVNYGLDASARVKVGDPCVAYYDIVCHSLCLVVLMMSRKDRFSVWEIEMFNEFNTISAYNGTEEAYRLCLKGQETEEMYRLYKEGETPQEFRENLADRIEQIKYIISVNGFKRKG